MPVDDAGHRPAPSAPPHLRPHPHQVAGHLWSDDGTTPGALVDPASGLFYKPLQPGPRGDRERVFYETASRLDGPASTLHAPLLAALPAFHGVFAWHDSATLLLALEDITATYARPCVLDVKIGHRTWHAGCDATERARRAAKDAATTQSALGWKVCGMQVWRAGGGGVRDGSVDSGDDGQQSPGRGFYWRAPKAWCKALTPATAPAALAAFATGPSTSPARVYGGRDGAAAAVRALAAWAGRQDAFAFHSASLLLCYDGGAAGPSADLRVRVAAVDFAHTYVTDERLLFLGRDRRPPPPAATRPHPSLVGVTDDNFAGGLAALATALDAAAAGGVVSAGDLAGVGV